MQIALLLLAGSLVLQAQQPPAGQTPPPQTPPAQTPAPKPRPAAPRPPGTTAARQTLTVQITDNVGKVLGDAIVIGTGPVDRNGTTDAEGSVTFRNLPPGSYRLRFEHEGHITLERDVTVQAGRPMRITAALNPAPKPTAPATPPQPVAPPAAAPASVNAEPMTVSIPDFVEKNYVGSGPTRRSAMGCTSSSTTTLVQLREPLADHSHIDADELIYVVAGEGTERVNNRDSALAAGTYALIPRGMSHSITRKGSRPLIYLSILSGPACTGGK